MYRCCCHCVGVHAVLCVRRFVHVLVDMLLNRRCVIEVLVYMRLQLWCCISVVYMLLCWCCCVGIVVLVLLYKGGYRCIVVYGDAYVLLYMCCCIDVVVNVLLYKYCCMFATVDIVSCEYNCIGVIVHVLLYRSRCLCVVPMLLYIWCCRFVVVDRLLQKCCVLMVLYIRRCIYGVV